MRTYIAQCQKFFIGPRAYELSITFTDGNLGDFRRFAVGSESDVAAICKRLNINPEVAINAWSTRK